MKRLFISITFLLISQLVFAWGQTGHRIVGEIAWQHLNKKAKKNIQLALGDEQLGMVGNWMDFIKSEPSFDSLKPWHYCTIPEGKTYAEVGAPHQGDAVMAINKFITELENGNYSVDEVFALKCLVHLVGDIHQPLHCGNGTDRGGNDVKVEYMWKKTNLHRVWDKDMIDGQQLSYTEYVNWINTATKDQIAKWQSSAVLDWVAESQQLHPQVYDFPENGKLSYRYTYDNIEALNTRLLQAGIRLAGILNNIYG